MSRYRVTINNYQYWIDMGTDPPILYETEESKNGISKENPGWTKQEKQQIDDFIKYDLSKLPKL